METTQRSATLSSRLASPWLAVFAIAAAILIFLPASMTERALVAAVVLMFVWQRRETVKHRLTMLSLEQEIQRLEAEKTQSDLRAELAPRFDDIEERLARLSLLSSDMSQPKVAAVPMTARPSRWFPTCLAVQGIVLAAFVLVTMKQSQFMTQELFQSRQESARASALAKAAAEMSVQHESYTTTALSRVEELTSSPFFAACIDSNWRSSQMPAQRRIRRPVVQALDVSDTGEAQAAPSRDQDRAQMQVPSNGAAEPPHRGWWVEKSER